MKKYLFIFISLFILGDIFSQNIPFFCETTNKNNYQASWGYYELPSELKLFHHSFPISKNISHSGNSSLRLQWQSKVNGNWGISLAPNSWTNFNYTYYDTLSFWFYNENIVDANCLPKISLEDDHFLKSDYLKLSKFINPLPLKKWTKINIPINSFLAKNTYANPLRLRAIFFSQNLPDGKEHTIFFDDITIKSKNILNGNSSLTVVVLGSSTAAGTGAKPIDSSWVNLYHNYLRSIDSTFQVVNLAVGGYTSYHLMPNTFHTNINRPSSVPGKNISYALSFNPSAIIINLPSNDVAYGFSIEEQFENYYRIKFLADSCKTPLWFTTTQPRNFAFEKRKQQETIKNKFYENFSNVFDFWNSISTSDYKILEEYNSGDGVHLNNKGHKLLFESIRNSNFLDKLLHSQVSNIRKVKK